MALPPPNGIVTLLTDFGSEDPYVGIMKGAVLRAHRRAVLVDICHQVPAQDLEVGAFFVAATLDRFPDGTVHLVVVDPGVGTGRRLIAVASRGSYWIGPDNGVLGPVAEDPDAEVVAIDLGALGLRAASRTFHGRDLFAPIAGALARGQYGFRALGPRCADPVLLRASARPRVLFVDGFGNLITNLPGGAIDPSRSAVRVCGRTMRFVGTYGEAERGAVVALVNSYGTVEIAVVDGSAASLLGVAPGAAVEVVPAAEGRGQA
jgi:S-adenosylmethionine hydrolase